MANTKKTGTQAKKSASKKKTSAAARKTGARTGAQKGRTAAKKTASRASAQAAPQRQIWNNITVGILLLLLAVVLVLALCRMDGVLLAGILKLVGGLIGWGTQLFWVALCMGGMFALCDLRPVRLRVTSILLFPVLWSALAQCIMVNPRLSVSFTSIIQLWQEGQNLHMGGVVGGMLASILSLLLSAMGAKILLVFVLGLLLFIIFNTTPARVWKRLRYAFAEDVEELHERDMSVTPAEETASKKAKKKPGLFRFLRNQRGKRRRAKLERAQAKRTPAPEEPAVPISDDMIEDTTWTEPTLDEAQEEAAARSRARYEKRMRRKQRLAEVMPEAVGPEAQPKTEEKAPEPDTPPWEEAAAAAEAQAEEPSKEEIHAQMHKEITDALEAPTAEYRKPPLELLKRAPVTSKTDIRAELRQSAARLVDTMASFGIDVNIINIVRGPSVTRFEIQVERGVKFSRVTSLSDDIALALGADSVRIAPIPDKLAVGIEVPNHTVQTVALRDVIGSKSFEKSKASLSVALGKDITGTAQVIDLAKMPHLLIAGTTGSGKSVCINSILISLLYKSAPEDVRLIMVDPKIVELGNYNGIPHLLIPVVTDPKKASGALSWAVSEMERRYALFAAVGVRGLSDYNALAAEQAAKGTDDAQTRRMEHLPRIVIVIDELADLMMVAAKEVETSICRIAQKARAAGMHLVVATQRPSTDVITGLMKSNIPSRIAFAVASQVESRIILDTTGADKLIGKGDMLYAPINLNKPLRIQGCFVSTEEIEKVIGFVKEGGEAEYSQEIMDHIERQAENDGAGYDASEDEDELLPEAISISVDAGQISASMLQRKLKLGYARAARLVDQMEQRGIVGPKDGSKPRDVLITRDDWMQMQMRAKDLP